MNDLILFSQQDPSIPRVSVTIQNEGTNFEGDVDAAQKAAAGTGAAPEISWKDKALTLKFLGAEIAVPASSDQRTERVCVAARDPKQPNGDVAFEVVSGGIRVDVSQFQTLPPVLNTVWPGIADSPMGKLDRLIVTAAGLEIETLDAHQNRRRFHLVKGAPVPSKEGQESRLVWRQIAWRDAELSGDSPAHKDPDHRLKQVEETSKVRLEPKAAAPVTHVNRFDERSDAEGAVFVHVQIKHDGTNTTSTARERIAPGWALSLGGADWAPRSLVIKGDPVVEKADFFYTDAVDAFEDPPGDQTSFEWSWDASAATPPVLPLLRKLTSTSQLVSTGEVPGAGVNLPYLWQRTRLEVGPDASKRTEPGVWLRYRLDSLPVRETAVSRQADYDAGLSRSIRLDNFQDDSGAKQNWRIDLSLLPDSGMSNARMWLALAPVDPPNSNARRVTLTMRNARIEAASPKIHALQKALNDPASLPNQADRFAGLHSDTRILLANDREMPDGEVTQVHALQAAQTEGKSRITLSAFGGANDVVVAYVPGPAAGIDLVPRVGGNLTPTASTNPNDPPPSDRVRNYESGLVAVHLKQNITLTPGSDQSLGMIQVSKTGDLFLPPEEMVAALHPWSLVRVQKDEFTEYELQPLHHNALLEAFDWARSTPDRKDAEPGALPPLVDPGISVPPETQPRDFRHDELRLAKEKAVRDRFSDSTTKPFLLSADSAQPVANWLPQVTFKEANTTIAPQIKRKADLLEALQFDWKGATKDLEPQSLALNPSPRLFTVAASGAFTTKAHGLKDGTPIQLLQTGTFPGGFAPNTTYYVVNATSSADTFQLSTTKGGSAITTDIVPGEGEWQPVAGDWLKAWQRWTAEDEDGKPTVHVHPNGKNGARRASDSDIPLLEQRTPITAVAAGWLKGRMWVFFAVDPPTPQDKPKLFAWEPLSMDIAKEITEITLQKGRIDFLEVDANLERIRLVIIQSASFQFRKITLKTSAGPNDLPLQFADPQVGVTLSAPITAARIAAQRLFLGTAGTDPTFFVYDIDDNDKPSPIAQSAAGKISALDVRASSNAKNLTVATASDDGKVRLFHWSSEITVPASDQPIQTIQPSAILTVQGFASGDKLPAVILQTITRTTDPKTNASVYAIWERSDLKSTRTVTWNLAPVVSSLTLASLNEFKGQSRGEKSLLALADIVRNLKTDPILKDDDDLGDVNPEARWILATTRANEVGQSNVFLWPVEKWVETEKAGDQLQSLRPQIADETRFGDHEGEVLSAALVPGRQTDAMMSPPEARFGAWVVTGGADGTVRVWDPESGQEKFRHTQTSKKYLDVLGVTRQKSTSTALDGFWAEVISVPKNDPKNDGNGRETVLLLSTIGSPVDVAPNVRFLCQDLTFTTAEGTNAWKPVPFDTQHRQYRHGVYGFCGNKSPVAGKENKVARLFGLPIEVVQVTKVVLDRTITAVTGGQDVTVTKMELDVILSNPTEMTPDGETVPIVDKEINDNEEEKITSALVHLVIDVSNGSVSLSTERKSTFDWRFPLTDQLPPDNQSVLPGRIARLAGTVKLDNNALILIPDDADEEKGTASRAEALGRLRRFIRLPQLVIDPSPDGVVRFRESFPDASESKLEQLGNPLPHPAGDFTLAPENAPPITATEIGTDGVGNSVALLGAQPGDDKPGSLQLSDLNTGQRLVNYTDRLKRVRLVVDEKVGGDGDAQVQRLSAIGVAADGTIRVRQLCKLKVDDNNSTVTEEFIEPAHQEQMRFALPSPAEDVQVFDYSYTDGSTRTTRWLLARCRDGSAWLWNSEVGSIFHNLSLPETAVTEIAFGPQLPEDQFSTPAFEAWRAFFGGLSPDLIAKKSLQAVLAIGGADGSVHVHAIEETGPRLARSFFLETSSPIKSLSLDIDLKSREAAFRGTGTTTGLVLLACDGTGPVRLREVLSGKTLIGEDDLNKDVGGSGMPQVRDGFTVYAQDALHVVLHFAKDGKQPLQAWAKEIAGDKFKTSQPVQSDLPTNVELHHCEEPKGCFAARNSENWQVYDLSSGSYILRFEQKTSVVDLANAKFNAKQRYVLTLQDTLGAALWRNVTDDPENWDELFVGKLSGAVRTDAATIGRVTVPIVACRGMEGQPGSFHAVDLAAAEWAWPEALGPVDAGTALAVAGIGGVPHLAVARSGNVTVWNLATGRLIHRVGLTTAVTEIELGEDLGQPWLLVGSATSGSWKTIELSLQGQSVHNVPIPADDLSQHARMFAFGNGLRIVSGTRTSDTATLTLQVTSPDVPGTPLTRQISNFTSTSFQILDAVEITDTVWVLLRHSNDSNSPQLSVLSVTPANAVIDVRYLISDASDAGKVLTGTLQVEDGNPTLWTIAEDYSEIAHWGFNLQTQPTKAVHSDQLGGPSIAAPTSISLQRHDGRKRLVAVAADGLAVWDIEEKKLLRTEKLSHPATRVSQVAVAAVVSADKEAGCLRFWDQESGRLRQRLFTGDNGLGELSGPGKLVALNSPARPRLVVAGSDKTVIVDVRNGLAAGSIAMKLSSLAATVAGKHIVIAALDENGSRKPKLWRTDLAANVVLSGIDLTLEGFDAPTKLALLDHMLPADSESDGEARTLLAAAQDTKVSVFKLSFVGGSLSLASALATPSAIVEADDSIQALQLSTAIQTDCVMAAVSLPPSGDNGRVQLFDLPLKLKENDPTDRPFTTWATDAIPSKVTTDLAVALTMDGPRLVAGTQALRVSELLRITAGMPPIYELPIRLLNKEQAFLSGRITPSRRLDLDIDVGEKQAKKLGLPENVTKFNARAALIQGPYSCFLIESIDRNDFRLAGMIVLWGDSRHSSDAMQGVLLLEDSYPTDPGDPANDMLGTSATLSIPTANSSAHIELLRGPRTRMRVMPFDADSEGIESLEWKETLSWYLAGKVEGGDARVELHLSDLLLDKKVLTDSADSAIVRAVFSQANKPAIQADLVVKMKRDTSTEEEAYTVSLENTAYAALAAFEPAASEFGTTRDDVVYPAIPDGSVGRAFDLVEPNLVPMSQDDNSIETPEDETEKRHLVTLVLDTSDNTIKLKKIKPPAGFAYDLNVGTSVTQSLPLQPIDVPQLEHREAHGARIRARWSSAFEEVQAGDTGDDLTADDKLWLLAPLVRTPRGIAALTLNLLVRPQGRALDWSRLLTESVLTIHRDGSILFGDTNSDDATGNPTVRNVLTSTILRSSGAAQSEVMMLFDDVRIQTHALRAGLSGVLLARTRDARGRVSYRFVNSPYHSLVPLAATRQEQQTSEALDEKLEDSDPRLLPPAVVYGMKTHGSPRFYPAYFSHERSALRGFERTPMLSQQPNGSSSERTLPAIRIAELPALRGAETPARPLVAESSPSNGAAFVPRSFELGFGVDKPGAAFHQIVQCVGTATADDMMMHSALPTTYLRRDPQRFAPPPRSSLRIDPATEFKRAKGKMTATIAWTETLSIVPMAKSDLATELTIIPDNPSTPTKYSLQPSPKPIRWFVRLGEQITEIGDQLTVPLKAVSEKRSVEAFDLFIVTRIPDLGAGTKLPNNASEPELKPYVVTIKGNGDAAAYKSVDAAAVLQKDDDASQNGFEFWRLVRKDDQTAAIPVLLKEIEPEGTRLNLVWLEDGTEIDKATYENAPKLLDVGKELKTRDVPYQPQSPRLHAVLRSSAGSNSGILSKVRELTLIEGPAASSNGLTVTLHSPEEEHPWIRFDAADAETVALSDPFTTDSSAKLHLVKVFDDGATLETHLEISATS